LFINEQNAGFDETLLEGLPLSQFNWNEWNVSQILGASQKEAGDIADIPIRPISRI
jgi:hypothetical protein